MRTRRALCAALAFLLLTGLFAGCGSDGEAGPEAEQPAAAVTDSPETEMPAETEVPAPPKSYEEIRGIAENGVYTNTALGLRCVLPEGWTAAAEEELEDFTELSAVSENRLSYVQISAQDLGAFDEAASLGEENFAAILLEQFRADPAYDSVELAAGTLGGRDCPIIRAVEEEYALEQDIFVLRAEQFMYVVMLTSADGSSEELTGCFTAVE